MESPNLTAYHAAKRAEVQSGLTMHGLASYHDAVMATNAAYAKLTDDERASLYTDSSLELGAANSGCDRCGTNDAAANGLCAECAEDEPSKPEPALDDNGAPMLPNTRVDGLWYRTFDYGRVEIMRGDDEQSHASEVDKSKPDWPFDFEQSYLSALDEYFNPWTFGYPYAFVGDGYMICTACARKMFNDPDSSDYDAIRSGECRGYVEHETYRSQTCDHCNEYIIPPSCFDCGDENADLFWNDNDTINICTECLGHAVVNRDDDRNCKAVKIGKRTYEVTNTHAAGTYTR